MKIFRSILAVLAALFLLCGQAAVIAGSRDVLFSPEGDMTMWSPGDNILDAGTLRKVLKRDSDANACFSVDTGSPGNMHWNNRDQFVVVDSKRCKPKLELRNGSCHEHMDLGTKCAAFCQISAFYFYAEPINLMPGKVCRYGEGCELKREQSYKVEISNSEVERHVFDATASVNPSATWGIGFKWQKLTGGGSTPSASRLRSRPHGKRDLGNGTQLDGQLSLDYPHMVMAILDRMAEMDAMAMNEPGPPVPMDWVAPSDSADSVDFDSSDSADSVDFDSSDSADSADSTVAAPLQRRGLMRNVAEGFQRRKSTSAARKSLREAARRRPELPRHPDDIPLADDAQSLGSNVEDANATIYMIDHEAEPFVPPPVPRRLQPAPRLNPVDQARANVAARMGKTIPISVPLPTFSSPQATIAMSFSAHWTNDWTRTYHHSVERASFTSITHKQIPGEGCGAFWAVPVAVAYCGWMALPRFPRPVQEQATAWLKSTDNPYESHLRLGSWPTNAVDRAKAYPPPMWNLTSGRCPVNYYEFPYCHAGPLYVPDGEDGQGQALQRTVWRPYCCDTKELLPSFAQPREVREQVNFDEFFKHHVKKDPRLFNPYLAWHPKAHQQDDAAWSEEDFDE